MRKFSVYYLPTSVVEGRPDLQIEVQFRPSLNLMWPAGIGGQETSWDQETRGFLLSGPSHQFRALISSPWQWSTAN